MDDVTKSLSKRYLAYETLSNFWFISAVWLYFYRLFITDQQVGVLDGLAFAIGLIAEVPSGALADRYGRDKIVRLGQFMTALGFLIQAFGSSYLPFVIGQAVMMTGVAFVSGADEALFYEKLSFDQLSWRKLVTRGKQFSMTAALFATVIGGVLHNINPRIPWILQGILLLISIIIIWPVKDTRTKKDSQGFSLEVHQYMRSIKHGFMEFFTPNLRSYLPIILIVQGLFYTAGWGLLKIVLLDRFYFTAFQGSIVLATSTLITVGILTIMHKHAKHMKEGPVVILISLAAAAGLLLSIADIGMWGYFVIFAIYAGEHLLYPFMSEILNARSNEEQRATVLSVASFMRTLPYVVLAPIIGFLSTHNNLEYFLVGWSILIVIAILLYLFLKKRDIIVNMTEAK